MSNLSRFAELDRATLARLVPELLMCGQLIDRSGMAWVISALGREAMTEVAIEEWMGASPIYTSRMQRALAFVGDDVITIFKGLQLDIGAPPQFLDFRFTVEDPHHGSFALASCGALNDVEPMGVDYVRAMCHDVEDPTFDATAVATNPRAQVRPLHRPPYDDRPGGRQGPACEWTVIIHESHPPVSKSAGCLRLENSRAATVELSPIDPTQDGAADYAGPLLSDLDFSAFSQSALVRLADEICLQSQLLNLSYVQAVRARLSDAEADEVCTKQAIGFAGIAMRRLMRVVDGWTALRLHPLLNPAAYVQVSVDPETITMRPSPAHDDGGWAGLPTAGLTAALAAAVREIDAEIGVVEEGDEGARLETSRGVETLTEARSSTIGMTWTTVRHTAPQPEPAEVAVAAFSSGVTFDFEHRRSLLITPI